MLFTFALITIAYSTCTDHQIKQLAYEVELDQSIADKMHDAAEDERKFVSIIGFECRGMDVVIWHPEVSYSGVLLQMHILSAEHRCHQFTY